jgi:hypothetical protein
MSANLVSLRLANPKEGIRLRTQSQVSSRPMVNSALMLSQAVRDRYRCPEDFLNFELSGDLSADEGYFRFGPNVIGYGRSSSGSRKAQPDSALDDLGETWAARQGTLTLPFDPSEIIDNLRLERYANDSADLQGALRKLYYWVRPLTIQFVRKRVQQFHARDWRQRNFPTWPVDTTVENLTERLMLLALAAKDTEQVPFIWFWPAGARGCLTMTHDVETEVGRDHCRELMDLDDAFGIKASFQFVPEKRYAVPSKLLESIRARGFEIGVHDLNHDGGLFDSREKFLRRAKIINRYGREYGARGFRAGVLYRKPEWYDALDFSFEMSIPNVAHLDPQHGGCCTVMPYFIGDILELPVTTTQDYTLFHLLNEHSIDLWKKQTDLILEKNGFASFIVHPDYVIEREPKRVYEVLLGYLQDLRARENVWFALPSEIDRWWRARSKMSVVPHGDSFRIEGEGAERAVLAFAKEVDGKLVYQVSESAATA